MIPALLICLAACNAPGGWCVTPCGVQAPANTTQAQCAALKSQEARAIGTYSREVPDWNAQVACRQWQGFEVQLSPADHTDEDGRGFHDGWGRHVGGLTNCDQGVIELPNTDYQHNALTHELEHAAENCADPNHITWPERHVFQAINDATTTETM